MCTSHPNLHQLRRTGYGGVGRGQDYNDLDEKLFDDPVANHDKIRAIAEKRVKLMGSIDKERHEGFVQREV